MSTKPTRQQARGADLLAQSLLLITEAARLDGRSPLDRVELADLARRVVKVSTAFDLDAILARALEARGQSLGLRSGTAELLTLVDGDVEPLASLLLSDEDFKAIVAKADEVLGEFGESP
jgi:hypothetical protein